MRLVSLAVIIFLVISGFILPVQAGSLSEDLQEFSQESPQDFFNLCRNIAAYYHKKGSWGKALAWTERILAVQPQNYSTQSYKAQLLASLGRYEESEELLKKLESDPQLKNSPFLVTVRNLLYETYKKAKKLSQKRKEIEKKLKAKEVDLDTYRQAFMIFRVAEQYSKTVKYAKQAIEAYPEESSFGFALAYAYERKRKTGKALDAYKDLIEKYPNNPQAYNLLLNMLKEKKLLKKAPELWEEFIKKDPNNLYKRFQLVDILYSLGKFDDTAIQLGLIQRAYPNNRQILMRLKSYWDGIQKQKSKAK